MPWLMWAGVGTEFVSLATLENIGITFQISITENARYKYSRFGGRQLAFPASANVGECRDEVHWSGRL
jgi:hypothetical protein